MNNSKRESFVFRQSFYKPIRELSTEDRGILIDAICNYAFDDIEPENLSPVLKMAFGFIVSTIDRDIAKYQSVVSRNQQNGKRGGRPKNPPESEESNEPKKPSGFLTNPPESEEPKKAYTECDSDSYSKCDSNSDSNCDSEKKKISHTKVFLNENGIFNKTSFEFLNSEEWFNVKAMQLGSTSVQIHTSSEDFLIDLRDRDMLEGKTLIDLRSHFVSWFKKHQPKSSGTFIPKIEER